jgi:hypothetical protein
MMRYLMWLQVVSQGLRATNSCASSPQGTSVESIAESEVTERTAIVGQGREIKAWFTPP